MKKTTILLAGIVLAALALWLASREQPGDTPPTNPLRPTTRPDHPTSKSTPPAILKKPSAPKRHPSTPALDGIVKAAESDMPLPDVSLWLIPSPSPMQDSSPLKKPQDRSDPTGCFHLILPKAENLLLIARARGRVEQEIPLTTTACKKKLTIRLQPATTITGLASEAETGLPLAMVTVIANAIGPNTSGLNTPPRQPTSRWVKTDELGQFRLTGIDPDFRYRLTAKSPNHEPTTTKIPIWPGGPSVILTLKKRGQALIRLIPPTANPPRGNLFIQTMGGFEDPGDFVEMKIPTWPPAGEILIKNLFKGKNRIRIITHEKKSRLPILEGLSPLFTLSPHQQTIVEIKLRPSLMVKGIALDHAGMVAKNLKVFACPVNHWILSSWGDHAHGANPKSDGTFYLPLLKARKSAILVEIPTQSALVIPYDFPPGNTTLDLGTIHLPKITGTISGTLRNTHGRPIAKALILLYHQKFNLHRWGAITDTKGTFKTTGLPWGQINITTIPPGTSPPPISPDRQPQTTTWTTLAPSAPSQRLELNLEN